MEINFCWKCGVKKFPAASYCHSCGNHLSIPDASPVTVPGPASGKNRSKPRTESSPTDRDVHSKLSLHKFVREVLGVDVEVQGVLPRFESPGWRYQGSTNIGCSECGNMYQVFRKPYETSKDNYEYWGIVCSGCLTCGGLAEMTDQNKKRLRQWAIATGTGVSRKKPDSAQSNALPVKKPKFGPSFVDKETSKKMPRSDTETQILPLPGDPGSTRRPGKKREYYRTGEEALLRNAAQKYRWW